MEGTIEAKVQGGAGVEGRAVPRAGLLVLLDAQAQLDWADWDCLLCVPRIRILSSAYVPRPVERRIRPTGEGCCERATWLVARLAQQCEAAVEQATVQYLGVSQRSTWDRLERVTRSCCVPMLANRCSVSFVCRHLWGDHQPGVQMQAGNLLDVSVLSSPSSPAARVCARYDYVHVPSVVSRYHVMLVSSWGSDSGLQRIREQLEETHAAASCHSAEAAGSVLSMQSPTTTITLP